MNRTALLVLVFALAACGPIGSHRPGDNSGGGGDGGKPVMMDDPNADMDGDGFTPAMGDCNDHDPTIFPGAPELCDGKDHNCNMIPDDICDDDKDGYAVVAGGKLPGGDCNDQDPLINPGAMEVPKNNIDDNCNGQTDEVPPTCDNSNKGDGKAFAGAMELCAPWVVDAKINADSDARSHEVRPHYGMKYTPKSGKNMIVFSTGNVGEVGDPNYKIPQPGTSFSNDDPNPSPMMNNNTCYNGPDEMTVHDYVELTLKLKVPTNAKSFSFNFNFMSAEYPEFVGTMFNDKFLALLDSQAFKGNISFDKNKNPITVNAGFFDVCKSAPICSGKMMSMCTKPESDLAGTGYDNGIGGGTDWLKTTAPVKPGETTTLRFIIFDEGDHIYDSAVLIDNFQWQVESSSGPTTIGVPPPGP